MPEVRVAAGVLLVVPNVARDLEGHALVAFELRRRGLRVRLTTPDRLADDLPDAAPDVLVLDYLDQSVRLRAARLARSAGAGVAVLPTAGFYHDEEAELRGAIARPDVAALVDVYLAWGPRVRDVLVGRGLLPPSRVAVTGCPRFDAYAKPLLNAVPARDVMLRALGVDRPNAPVVVWTTNTYHQELRTTAGPRTGNASAAARREAHPELALETSRRAYEDLAAAVGRVADAHPDWVVLVKLHPSEVAAPYHALCEGRPGMRVVRDARIRDLLHHADVLVQRCSTTATEAWMLGKPVVECSPDEGEQFARRAYLDGNHVSRGVDEAVRAVESYAAGATVTDAQHTARGAFVAETYHRVDGLSAARCADAIAALARSVRDTDDGGAAVRRAFGEAHAARRRAEDGRWANRVKDMLHVPRSVPLRSPRALAAAVVRPAHAARSTDALHAAEPQLRHLDAAFDVAYGPALRSGSPASPTAAAHA